MPSQQRTTVMIVDDHSMMRIGLQQVLEQSGEFEVVGQAADAMSTLASVLCERTHFSRVAP